MDLQVPVTCSQKWKVKICLHWILCSNDNPRKKPFKNFPTEVYFWYRMLITFVSKLCSRKSNFNDSSDYLLSNLVIPNLSEVSVLWFTSICLCSWSFIKAYLKLNWFKAKFALHFHEFCDTLQQLVICWRLTKPGLGVTALDPLLSFFVLHSSSHSQSTFFLSSLCSVFILPHSLHFHF